MRNKYSGNESEGQAQSTLELMKKSRRWLVWKYVDSDKPDRKQNKVPYYVSGKARAVGISLDSPADIEQLATYQQASDCLVGGGYSGVGFALGYDADLNAYWQGIDLDGMELSGLGSLANKLPSYVEQSPSGKGVHCIGLGQRFENLPPGAIKGIEAYSTGRFFTFTGRGVLRDEPPVDLLTWRGDERLQLYPAKPRDEVETWDGLPDILESYRIEQLEWAMGKYLDADDRGDWINAGYALRRYGDVGRRIWDAWSITSEKFDKQDQESSWKGMSNVRSSVDYLFKLMGERGCDLSELSRMGLKTRAGENLTLQRIHLPIDLRTIKPVEYILDGQIPVGSLTVAGVRGGGKTTLLAGLTPVITGTCNPLHVMKPRVARKVIWVTEDGDQIVRIITAMINAGLIFDVNAFRERFIMIQAKRSDPAQLASALGVLGTEEGRLINRFERGEHEAAPLVLLDTVAATLEIKDENSNSDVSRAVAAVRQSITEASVWFVTHVAKGMGRMDTLRDMTARGASAFESDVQGNAVLALEDDLPDKRFLILGKKRVDADRNEITATRLRWQTETSAVWGDRTERISYAMVEATDQAEREEAVEEARETAEERKLEAAERRIQEACQAAANDARNEGFEGLVIRGGRGGGEGPIEGYENLKRVRIDWLRKDICGVRGNKTEVKAGFKQTICRLFEFNGDIEDEHCIIAIRAETFDVSGVTK